jgi:hypothetical protein
MGAEHLYGGKCYGPNGCASIIELVSRRIDARRFNGDFPRVFPRFVQLAIWRFCAQDVVDQCNGTRGIAGRPDTAEILARVAGFNDFTEDNDPYGEHDFGAIVHQADKIFWKIDYYDPDLKFGSTDPSDPKLTTRVLTVMLADEY